MDNPIKRKINIFGKVAKIITTVLIVCLLVAEGFLLVGGIFVAAAPRDSVTVDVSAAADINVDTKYFGLDGDQVYFSAGDKKIAVGDVSTDDVQITEKDGSLNVTGEVKDMHYDLRAALSLIVFGMIMIASVVVALFFFKALMKQFMVCDSPFSDAVVQKMRNFAIALIPCLAVSQGMKAAMGAVFSDSYTMNFDFASAAFVLIIFVLTMIFKYGAELQKEHDETV